MSRRVVARTSYQPETLTPLIRRADGTLQPAPPGSEIQWQPEAGTTFPGGMPLTPSEAPWMERETLVPGLKNSTAVLIGAGLVGLGLFLVMKSRQQVIA